MEHSTSLRLGARQVSIIGVFAALHAVVSLLPFTLSIGVSGQITLGVITAPLIGILAGPFIGGIAVMIGSFVAGFMNPAGAIFGLASFVPPTIGAVGAGSVRSSRSYLAGMVIVISVLVFYAHPYGREVFYYPWLQLVAAAICFLPISNTYRRGFDSSEVKKIAPVFVVAAFVGTLADHASGSAMGIWYFSAFLGPEIWKAIAFVYPIERVVATILCSLVGIPVYQRLKVAGLLDTIR
jgi:hypothetical protein